MQKLILVLSLLLPNYSCTNEDDPTEKSFEGDVWLLKQSEVIDFGRKGYRKINGNLHIGDDCAYNSNCEKNTDITDLTPLRSLSHIEDKLIIGSYGLTTLDGLENLNHVGGMSIWPAQVTSLAAFSNLDSIGYVFLSHLNIQDLYGFHNLKYVRDDFYIHSCGSLESLGELKMLDHVGGLRLHNLHGLSNLAGLEKITNVAGEVDIFNNHNLRELSGLNNLHHVGGALRIISEDLSLAALENLDSVGELTLSTKGYEFSGLHNLKYIKNKFSVSSCMNLQNLGDLNNLRHIGQLEIIWNANLTTLAGLENVTNKVGDVAVFKNPKLKDLCGLVPMAKNGLVGKYDVYENGYNPTKEDLLNENCNN